MSERSERTIEHGRRVAIVGGGMLGLTLAHRLAQGGASVTVLEAAPELGGLASAWELGGVTWDRHYHVTLLSDERVLALVRELGLGDDLVFSTARSGCFADGRVHPVSTPLELLRFRALRPLDRVRIGLTLAVTSKRHDWQRLERLPVDEWLVRWSGRRGFQRFWLPLLRSKLGDRYTEASAAFLWATVQRLTKARRAGLRTELFGHVRGGYARLLDRLAATLADEGVTVRTGTPVQRVERSATGVLVTTADGTDEFDEVVLTVATPLVSALVPGLTDDEHERLRSVRYQGVVCASVLLRRPLDGYYLTSAVDDGLPFTAVVEMTSIVDPDEVGGHTLVYLPRYAAPEDPLFRAGDDEVEASFLAGLRRVYPSVGDDDVLAFRVSRVPRVFAVPTLGYSERVPPSTTSIPGVSVVTGAQIVNGTLNVEETVTLAEDAAARLLAARPQPIGAA